DDVVTPPHEPEPAVIVAAGQVAGEIPATGEALRVPLGLVQVTAEHRRPPRTERELSLRTRLDLDRHSGLVDDEVAVLVTGEDRRLHTGEGPAHRAGPHRRAGVV